MSSASSHFDRNTSLPERRAHQRQTVRSLAYIELGDGNGGIVLNISEGGMAIQAVMSLKETDLPLMRVQLAHSTKQVQAKGRISWTTSLRRLAGVEFVDLSEETREQIREWISLESPAQEPPETVEPAAEESTPAASKLAEPANSAPEPATSPTQQGRNKPFAAPIEAWVSAPVAIPVRLRAPVVPAAAVPPAFVPAPPASTAATTAAVRPLVSPTSATNTKGTPVGSETRTEADPSQIPPPAANTIAAEPAVAIQPEPPTKPPAAPSLLRDPARLPPDRFGFKLIARPEPVLKAVSQEPREKWKLSAWVAIFVIVPLGAGWIAGHGALHGVFQKGTGNSRSGNVAAENAPGTVSNSLDISEIEVVDLNNQRWMIPMPGPLGPLTSRRFESAAPPRPQENRMNFRVWTLSPPVHSQSSSAEIKSTPPILASSSNGPENVLPSGGTASLGEGILVPPPPTANLSESGLQPGELIRKVEPVYPPSAIDQKLEGAVRLFAVIDENGNIKSLQPLSGPRLLFPAALDAVRQWRYSPTLLDGRPIQTERQVIVVFQLAKTQ